VRRAFGNGWIPCAAHARNISTRDGDIFLSVTAFPIINHSQSRRGHLVFSGTRISITADWLAARV
jgi:hypothetical protein